MQAANVELCVPKTRNHLRHNIARLSLSLDYLLVFYKKMGQPRPLFRLCTVFSNKQYNFRNKSIWKNVQKSIQCMAPGFESTTLEHELSTITTRPGAPPTTYLLFPPTNCKQTFAKTFCRPIWGWFDYFRFSLLLLHACKCPMNFGEISMKATHVHYLGHLSSSSCK